MNNNKVELKDLIESSVDLGVLTSMNYTHAIVASSDYKVNAAGGVPRNCFLLAVPKNDDLQEAILLSVRDIADLESLKAFKVLKEDLAQNTISQNIDAQTRQRIQAIGYNCKIVGTFYQDDNGLQFGSDVDRVLAYSSYKVLRPMGTSLSYIASFSRPSVNATNDNIPMTVDVGVVRYTETQKIPDKDAKVMVNVKDFIGKKTAVFGMSRSGKALTADTKIPVPKSNKFPNGWARNDELDINDYVYSTNMTPIKILELKPWEQKSTYLVKLSDGTEIKAAHDHLWTITKTKFNLNQEINEIAAAIIDYAKYVGVGTYTSLAEISRKTNIPTDVLFNIAKYTKINDHLIITDNKYTGDAGDSIYYPVSELLYNVAKYINNNNQKESLDIIVTTQDLKDNVNEEWYIRVKNNTNFVKVVDVIDNGNKDVRCLTVDSIDSLHLVENYIPTHNSNTVKILTQQVYEYSKINKMKIGQLIFDPQGEYANENSQDNGALAKMGNGHDVVVYRTHLKNDDTYEKLLLINLLEEANLELLWQLMLSELNNGMSKGANYTSSLSSINFEKPQKSLIPDIATYKSASAKYERRKLALYAFLKLSRYTGNIANFYVNVGKDNVDTVLNLVSDGSLRPAPTQPGTVVVANIDGAYKLFHWLLSQVDATKELMVNTNDDSPLDITNGETRTISSISQSWINDFEEGDLAEFKKQFENYENGRNGVVAAFNRLKELHSGDSKGDVRDNIWEDLEKGRVVIIDLSKGSPAVTTKLSELIVNSLISKSSNLFTSNKDPMPFQITVEEAHNLFRREGIKDSDVDPWVRLSKEAAKYHIGLVYATQEVSGVDPQILSNTSNWVIAHLNSKKETHELSSYYSFADWEEHLRSTEAKGFVRLKTESSPFVVPVQIAKFESNKEK